MLNLTQIISCPKDDFSYPACFLFSLPVTSKCPVFTFIPYLLVPCMKIASLTNIAT